MTTARRAIQPRDRRPPAPTSKLVMHRRVGEGFSLGEDWRFDVADLTARFVTLAATSGARTTRWQLEVDDALQLTAANTLTRRRQPRADPALFEVRVARVVTNRTSLLIHAPRSLKITRHEPTPPHGNPS